MAFVHLHTHSHYSLLDGLPHVDQIVSRAKKLGQPAVALTDHGALYGAIELIKACKKADIKPIIGIEAYVASRNLSDREGAQDREYTHIILLAKNFTGYQNLVKLTTIAHMEGVYYKPRVDKTTLKQYAEGLICLTGCLGGEVARAALSQGPEAALTVIQQWQDIFGPENVYIEVQPPEQPEQQQVNGILKELSRQHGLNLVATADSHYLSPEDANEQDILLCIQTKQKITDVDRFTMRGVDLSFKTEEHMRAAFADMPEAVDNTVKIAEKINVDIQLGKIQIPQYDLPPGVTPDQELRRLCVEGVDKRYGSDRPDVMDRLKYELEVIEKTGFSSYFLIVQDFINWAKNQGIVVGPGRGSAAGSLVSYVTNITDIDPIAYDLLFERFLNPERVSMPDIDTDFADTRRNDVLHYITQKYGKDHVAQIITFGTMAARAAVRDVGRVLGLSYGFCDRLAKMIPAMTDIDEALKTVPELSTLYATDPDAQRVIDAAKKLEGVARHTSTHACAVVITRDSLTDLIPLQKAAGAEDESIITQYEMHAIEDLGVLKMDFLGLKNLTIIEDTLHIIQVTTDQKIDINTIPLDDQKTFNLLQAGDTTGVFQLESAGMKRYLKQLKPKELEDIIAMVSLYRPGPMEFIPEYIEGRHGRRTPEYLHPKLKPILEKTYGIAVYQEQIMQIARDLAGFTYGQADVLRKAVGKKIKALLEEQEEKMVKGMVAGGIPDKTAQQIWDFILPFARYGFNRSHGACYAMIAYRTAYLKANFPAQFMAALLTSENGDTDRISIEVTECRRMGMEIMAPDVNESFSTFTVVKETAGTTHPRIRFGLTAIKNVGANVIRKLIDERKANGAYQSLSDLLWRVQDRDLNKKSLESLIKAGALDRFSERGQLLANLDHFLVYIKRAQEIKQQKQVSLFGGGMGEQAERPELKLEPSVPVKELERLLWEKNLLGLYISSHPLESLRPLLSQFTPTIQSVSGLADDTPVSVIGVAELVKRVTTKKGDAMLFVHLEDETGALEAVVFPKTFASTATVWEEGQAVSVSGKINHRNGTPSIVVDKASRLELTDLNNQIESAQLHVTVPSSMKRSHLEKLKGILAETPGPIPVFLKLQDKLVDTKCRVSPEVVQKVDLLLGTGASKMVYSTT
ncbi:MAG: DNA polymerase III subunit alpha [Patescibacteria group bacterium]